MGKIIHSLRSSLILMLLLTVLLGVVYPFMVMGAGQVLFGYRANGSLLERGGKIVGSSLLGQEFEAPGYFWGRLSATTPPYNPVSSGATNYNPANSKLLEAANIRMAALQKADSHNKDLIPVELITASASGVDPHISVAAALYQLNRVAKARGMTEDEIKTLINQYTVPQFLGLYGEPYVNIVQLNLALDDRTKGKVKEKR